MAWIYSSTSSTQTGLETFPAVVTQILNDEALTSSSGNKNGLLDSMTDVRK